ncbi:MAG: hypothetical protein K0Q59_146 [Paenibacillus sp.]|jgi:hypothetical protein|nr:hypothetical protein [Paenibacillus sp.]
MTTFKLVDLAKTIRSKNAGTDKITFDIIFTDRDLYEKVKAGGSLTKSSVARLFALDESRFSDFVEFDPALAIKFTIFRTMPSGSPGDRDIFGCQQYPPLLDMDISIELKEE